MACTGLAVVIASPQEPLLQCALCLLMFNMVIHSFETLTYCFEIQLNEMAPNE